MVYALIAAALVALIVLLAILRRKSHLTEWPLMAKPLLGQAEQALYFRLLKALPDKIVLSQVQLSRFLVVKGTQHAQSVRNRIDRKSADFLVCRRDFSVLAAIELDDKSQDSAKARKRDGDNSAALAAAGIRLIRFQARNLPSEDEIRTILAEAEMPRIVAER